MCRQRFTTHPCPVDLQGNPSGYAVHCGCQLTVTGCLLMALSSLQAWLLPPYQQVHWVLNAQSISSLGSTRLPPRPAKLLGLESLDKNHIKPHVCRAVLFFLFEIQVIKNGFTGPIRYQDLNSRNGPLTPLKANVQ